MGSYTSCPSTGFLLCDLETLLQRSVSVQARGAGIRARSRVRVVPRGDQCVFPWGWLRLEVFLHIL